MQLFSTIKRFYSGLFILGFTCLSLSVDAQQLDSIRVPDSTLQETRSFKELLNDYGFLRPDPPGFSDNEKVKHHRDVDIIFYSLVFVLFLLGILKTTFTRYYDNLFKVFFNSSLRQNQLTDQLLLGNLPSMFFNLFFVISAGFYIYLLIFYFGGIASLTDWPVLFISFSAVTLIYMMKYASLKFSGWVSGFEKEADIYIFIVFLANKIMGIVLIPFILLIAFSDPPLAKASVIASFVLIACLLAMRFFKSYRLLENRIRINFFHFLLYIIALEILPLFLIYKAAFILLSKNL